MRNQIQPECQGSFCSFFCVENQKDILKYTMPNPTCIPMPSKSKRGFQILNFQFQQCGEHFFLIRNQDFIERDERIQLSW